MICVVSTCYIRISIFDQSWAFFRIAQTTWWQFKYVRPPQRNHRHLMAKMNNCANRTWRDEFIIANTPIAYKIGQPVIAKDCCHDLYLLCLGRCSALFASGLRLSAWWRWPLSSLSNSSWCFFISQDGHLNGDRLHLVCWCHWQVNLKIGKERWEFLPTSR